MPEPTRPPQPATRRHITVYISILASLFALFTLALLLLRPHPSRPPGEPPPPSLSRKSFPVLPGEILPFVLNRAGLGKETADRVLTALREVNFNFRRIRPGDSLVLVYRNDSLIGLYYWHSYDSIYQIDIDSTTCRVTLTSLPLTVVPAVIRGGIRGSLYQALLELGERPELVAAYTEIFDWDIDFFSETQPGDSFFILVSKKYSDSTLVGYTPIHAARYKGASGDFFAFRFTDPEGGTDYYNFDGLSVRKTFLKSPLRFSRITSFFGPRFHPIRRIPARHQGVDYAAPRGTPVVAVADGRVIAAGFSGGYGLLVRIGHRAGYETRYGHLSRLGKGVRPGAWVNQGEVIGYVGSTGLSTGPHLHYEVRKFGTPVNPLRLNPPRAGALKLAYLPAFRVYRDSLISLLNSPPPQPPVP